MKLIRFGDPGYEQPGVELDDGSRIDVSGFDEDYDELFFGGDGLERLADWVEMNHDSVPRVPPLARLGPPIVRPSKIICIGLNYSDHAKESGMKVPDEPVIFFKATSALSGPNDDVVIPKGSTKMDYEVELAFVIGKKASYVSKERAWEHVAGFALTNDYSERAFQIETSGQWVKGKSCDTFAPLGPWLVTPDEIDDYKNLNIWLDVNGESRQNSSTSYMIYDVPYLVEALSGYMTLLPGDIVSTGTPPGVGLGFKPPKYLNAGDVVEQGIDGLGESTQEIVAYEH
jgi:2-keto-4-pentenoate hydratase/2-oxohepta-3-ene-1,7-dioic acid hydratase in catechol pathway